MPALQRFVVAVQLLPTTATEASRAQLSDALRRLSGALREAAPDNVDVDARAERIRVLAG
ncbi:MAG: hypothetical protein HY269_09770, partial [Deltaproteobacteria bacterium]|nr:hypothetical protein [Deltaproteobacteria bacterium]